MNDLSVATSASSSDPPNNHAPPVMDLDHDRTRQASVLSMDDLEAAQALEGLRADYGQSPRLSRTNPPVSPDPQQPEPLLSLLTSSHPFISSAINGSVSAYTTSKSYSARFKSGAEFIERNIGSPVANTVGSVGRKTGVESGLRWALQRRDSNSQEANSANKRRKVDQAEQPMTDLEQGPEEPVSHPRPRSSSDLSMEETLPPYDDLRSPRYEEKPRRQTPGTWQSRLVISTSGLGVAMSEESLRSLQYCLTWLRWANSRLGKSIVALQRAMTEWESQRKSQAEGGASTSLLTQRIQAVREDVLSTLKQVVDVVSKYAGGALPENARHLVRRHLTSLPHRFQMASTSQPPPDSPSASSDATLGAHRILVLANEGLDILGQVSGVVNDTLVSAEHWCERLGRKRPESQSAPDAEKQGPVHPASDAQPYGMDIKEPIATETAAQADVQMAGTERV
ncbi:hypothetical protein N7468_007947 [Penicillium chermesinum]|uniref:Clock controled protein n=1 Tax=Penicillium chermesinum TaxID=63820 RepID=A0A9W9NNU1_9EURO|nr:uncharacterized protein N7468_007947 [Penicillium chermesinum]KAJ5223405.1 hypothetical protein N7468_007947 [Penicillium chermesinum]KAJ6155756.1 hypothetical protein N7470_006322 [Penicillium chermesinum]